MKMESVRLPNSFSNNPALMDAGSLMGMKTTNNHHFGQGPPVQPQPQPSLNRMPDPTNNLTFLSQHQQALPQLPPGAGTTGAGSAGASAGIGGSRVFYATQLESRDELDEKHDKCYSLVMNCVSGKSEKEAVDALTVLVGKDPRAHEDVCLGLVILILTNPSNTDGEMNASRCFRDLTLICRDGLASVLSHLTHLILEKYLKLMPHVKNQLMWLVREMVRSSIAGMDMIVWNLMRQIAGGDVGRGNLWLVDSLLELFNEHRTWLDKFPFLVASVAYTYLRLIEDHVTPPFEKLREKEVKFVIGLIRDRFTDVMTIGRDFVRILQNVARLPEIGELWRDLIHQPRTLSPTFSGLAQLMETRTSRRFLQCRITPEMEKKLVFLTSQVKFGSHKRYQDWFQRQYLSTQESQSLRCDLIRFIVGVIHPTNELLCSDIIPRWAVIGWLLTTCTSQVAASNAKLALFYDWLFFEPDKDNIMNIEPAILVMHHSIKPHPAITATLLDFLCRIITNFFPRQQEKVRNGIYSSLKQILEKRVLPSLSPLFDNPKLDKELKVLLQERFAPFVDTGGGRAPPTTLDRSLDSSLAEEPLEVTPVYLQEPLEDLSACSAQFSDDEIEEVKPEVQEVVAVTSGNKKVNHAKKKMTNSGNGSSSKKESNHNSNSSRSSPTKVRKRPSKPPPPPQNLVGSETEASGNGLGEDIRQILGVLQSTAASSLPGIEAGHENPVRSDDEEKCEVMDQLIRLVTSEDLSYEQCNALAQRLSQILQADFVGKIFPVAAAVGSTLSSKHREEALEDSVGRPLFVAFRALCDMADSNDGSGVLLQILAELYALQPRVGYYLLYFLSVDKQARQREARTKATIYKDLCETIDANYCLDICLINDMRQCQEDDVELFVHLVADVYHIFPKTAVGNVNLLYLVVSCVDGGHIQQLVCHILARDLLLFKKDTFATIVTGSLTWETFEQFALWQLIGAHQVPIDCLYHILPKLNFAKHAEALTSTLLRLRAERPNTDLVRHVLSRDPVHGDRFVSTLLNHWLNEHEDKLAELISNYLSKQASSTGASGSGSGSGGGSGSSATGLKRKRGGSALSSSGSTSGNAYSSSSGYSSSSNGGISRKAETALTHLDILRQNCRQYEFFSHSNLQTALRTCRQLCSDDQKKKFMDLFALAETDSDDEDEDDPLPPLKSTSGNGSSTGSGSRKNKSKSGSRSRKVNDDDSADSSDSDNSDEEDTKPLSRSGHKGHRSGSKSKSTSGGSGGRKRPPSSSKKYVMSSEDSDDETTAKKKKRRKKAVPPSDSD